jgi:hypothetical protein
MTNLAPNSIHFRFTYMFIRILPHLFRWATGYYRHNLSNAQQTICDKSACQTKRDGTDRHAACFPTRYLLTRRAVANQPRPIIKRYAKSIKR